MAGAAPVSSPAPVASPVASPATSPATSPPSASRATPRPYGDATCEAASARTPPSTSGPGSTGWFGRRRRFRRGGCERRRRFRQGCCGRRRRFRRGRAWGMPPGWARRFKGGVGHRGVAIGGGGRPGRDSFAVARQAIYRDFPYSGSRWRWLLPYVGVPGRRGYVVLLSRLP